MRGIVTRRECYSHCRDSTSVSSHFCHNQAEMGTPGQWKRTFYKSKTPPGRTTSDTGGAALNLILWTGRQAALTTGRANAGAVFGDQQDCEDDGSNSHAAPKHRSAEHSESRMENGVCHKRSGAQRGHQELLSLHSGDARCWRVGVSQRTLSHAPQITPVLMRWLRIGRARSWDFSGLSRGVLKSPDWPV